MDNLTGRTLSSAGARRAFDSHLGALLKAAGEPGWGAAGTMSSDGNLPEGARNGDGGEQDEQLAVYDAAGHKSVNPLPACSSKAASLVRQRHRELRKAAETARRLVGHLPGPDPSYPSAVRRQSEQGRPLGPLELAALGLAGPLGSTGVNLQAGGDTSMGGERTSLPIERMLGLASPMPAKAARASRLAKALNRMSPERQEKLAYVAWALVGGFDGLPLD